MRSGRNKAVVEHAQGCEEFDRVVLATHSDVAARLRGTDASAAETDVLAAIPYADNDVYLHRGAPRRANVGTVATGRLNLVDACMHQHRLLCCNGSAACRWSQGRNHEGY